MLKATPNKFKSKGFTLIELLLVVALLALSMGVTTDILLSLVRSYNKTQVTHEIEQQANFVSLKLEKELRDASHAEVSLNGELLRITTPYATVRYRIEEVSGGAETYYVLQRNDISDLDADYIDITNSSQVSGITVECAHAGDGVCFTLASTSPDIVTFDFAFSKANTGGLTPFSAEFEVHNVIVLRNTY